MGVGRSSLNSKLVPHRSLQPFTAWGAAEVGRMLSFHANELGAAFALGPEQFFLMTLRAAGSRPLAKVAFAEVFDTDRNNLVRQRMLGPAASPAAAAAALPARRCCLLPAPACDPALHARATHPLRPC